VASSVDQLQLASGQAGGEAPPDVDRPDGVGGAVHHQGGLADGGGLGVRQHQAGREAAATDDLPDHVALVAGPVGLPRHGQAPLGERLRDLAGGVAERGQLLVEHPAALGQTGDDPAQRRAQQPDERRDADLAGQRAATQQDQAVHPPGVGLGQPQHPQVPDRAAHRPHPVDLEGVQGLAQQLGGQRPVGRPRVVHRRAQAPAGPVQDQATEAAQLAQQRGEVGAGAAGAVDEQDRVSRAELLHPQPDRRRADLDEPLGRGQVVGVPEGPLGAPVALDAGVGGRSDPGAVAGGHGRSFRGIDGSILEAAPAPRIEQNLY